jgi:hypothetical protein
MLVHVLVLVVLVDRHPHAAHLGQHDVTETGRHQQVDTGDRVRTQHQLVELGRHPLDGDATQLQCHLLHRRAHPWRDRETQLRDESRRAQHPQRIVAERDLRRGRSVEDAGPDRGQTP